jgi:hypothetical protein
VIEIGAAYVALASMLVAFISDPDPKRPMQNIPHSRWQWLLVEFPFGLLVLAAVLTVLAYAMAVIQ